MENIDEKLTVIFEKDGKQTIANSDISGKRKIVVVINNQFTNAPNTTQIASGAGRNSAAGNNAAIDSSNTQQQQSVGAGGRAVNVGMKGKQVEPHIEPGSGHNDEEFVIVINNQIVAALDNPEETDFSAATQVASGSGFLSTGGTNSAIESSNTKQQHGVGGGEGARAINKRMNSAQKETAKHRRKKRKSSSRSNKNKRRKNSRRRRYD